MYETLPVSATVKDTVHVPTRRWSSASRRNPQEMSRQESELHGGVDKPHEPGDGKTVQTWDLGEVAEIFYDVSESPGEGFEDGTMALEGEDDEERAGAEDEGKDEVVFWGRSVR